MPALKAFGNLYFSLTREQWDRTHLTQINPDGIVGFVELLRRGPEVHFFFVQFLPHPAALRRDDINAFPLQCGGEVIKLHFGLGFLAKEALALHVAQIRFMGIGIGPVMLIGVLVISGQNYLSGAGGESRRLSKLQGDGGIQLLGRAQSKLQNAGTLTLA